MCDMILLWKKPVLDVNKNSLLIIFTKTRTAKMGTMLDVEVAQPSIQENTELDSLKNLRPQLLNINTELR